MSAAERETGEKAKPNKSLPPTAERALAEAAARRAEYEQREREAPPETGGRGGKEPVRYGDWEIKGRAIDF